MIHFYAPSSPAHIYVLFLLEQINTFVLRKLSLCFLFTLDVFSLERVPTQTSNFRKPRGRSKHVPLRFELPTFA